MRHAIILFHDYYNKQQAKAREKIEKDRQELPITKYEKAIIYTLRKHRVLLIAGDTGCGKSTQGWWYITRMVLLSCPLYLSVISSTNATKSRFQPHSLYTAQTDSLLIISKACKVNERKICSMTEGTSNFDDI
jgi:predicted ATP-dependent serine protease